MHTQRCESQNRCINLKQEPPLLRRLIKSIPNIACPFFLRLQLNDSRIACSLNSTLIQNHGFLVNCHVQNFGIQARQRLSWRSGTFPDPKVNQVLSKSQNMRPIPALWVGCPDSTFRYNPCIYRNFDPAKMSYIQELFVCSREGPILRQGFFPRYGDR